MGAANPSSTEAGTAKLVGAAQEFEAMMLGEMLKPLHFGAGVDEAGDEGQGGAADTIRGLATDALGKSLAAHGGVGIARKIITEVSAEHEARTKIKKGTKVA